MVWVRMKNVMMVLTAIILINVMMIVHLLIVVMVLFRLLMVKLRTKSVMMVIL